MLLRPAGLGLVQIGDIVISDAAAFGERKRAGACPVPLTLLVAMVEAAAVAVLAVACTLYGWALLGLLSPKAARLPSRWWSVAVWAASFVLWLLSGLLASG